MVKGKAWFRIKDPPAGEGQVGLTYHTYSHNTSDTPQKQYDPSIPGYKDTILPFLRYPP